jgi:non-specific serine/threonine protein kinase
MSGLPPPDQGPATATQAVPFTWNERPLAANLPVPLTPFIGRERDVEAVSALLHRSGIRLITLTGPGGIGKTRLALRIAGLALARYDDGVTSVALGSVRDPGLVLPTIVQALDMPELADQPLLARLQDYLSPRHLLLMLDNLEHLLDAAPVLAELLASSPRLTLLCTSRMRLGISGEHVFTVPPMTLPEPGADQAVDSIGDSDAVRLFVQRAEASASGFALTSEIAPAVAELCRRLDGLPLAIELAAARTMVLPPRALLERLEHRLDLLTGGPRDAPERLRGMREAIAWSHDLLTEPERVLFRRLGVFSGGFTLDAAQAIAGGEADVLEGISALVAASLVNPLGTVPGDPRFTMLETIREYALEQLAASGEETQARDAHARWCIDLAEAAMPWWSSPRQSLWMDRCETEHDNLRAALGWLAEPPRISDAVRLMGAIWFYWFACSHWSESRTWLERALEWSDGERTLRRARVLNGAAALALSEGDADRSLELGMESLALLRDIDEGDLVWIGDSPLVGLGATAEGLGSHDQATDYNEQALALCRRLAGTLPGAAITASVVLTNMAFVAWHQDDEPRATRLAEESLAVQEDHGFSWGAADSLFLLAIIAARKGDTGRAVALYRRGIVMAMESRDLLQIVQVLDPLTLLAANGDNPERAASLFGASARIHEVLGSEIPQELHAEWNQAVTATRMHLGDPAFAAAMSTGRALTVGDAVAEALLVEAPTVPRPGDAAGAPDRMGLTRREHEVLRLLADGRSNRSIAEALSLSERTVENHVLHILTKLNLESRTAAATFAVRSGLE